MKTTQKSLAENRSKSGGSRTPRQPGKGVGSMKSLDQKKVVECGVHAKKGK